MDQVALEGVEHCMDPALEKGV